MKEILVKWSFSSDVDHTLRDLANFRSDYKDRNGKWKSGYIPETYINAVCEKIRTSDRNFVNYFFAKLVDNLTYPRVSLPKSVMSILTRASNEEISQKRYLAYQLAKLDENELQEILDIRVAILMPTPKPEPKPKPSSDNEGVSLFRK